VSLARRCDIAHLLLLKIWKKFKQNNKKKCLMFKHLNIKH
jgi:hypothetical protein